MSALPWSRMDVHCALTSPLRDGVSVWVTSIHGDKREIGQPMVFDAYAEGSLIEPSLQMDMTAAQRLMDALWDCGLRPSEGSGSAGALAATQRHLEDMRRLVFEVPK